MTDHIEAAALLCDKRAEYYEGAKGYREWTDAARSYRSTAEEIRALRRPVPTSGHGYEGEFTAKEFFERAFDHDKAARNGLSAGPNVSYVRTFQACAAALRYAAENMFGKDDASLPGRDEEAIRAEERERCEKIVTSWWADNHPSVMKRNAALERAIAEILTAIRSQTESGS